MFTLIHLATAAVLLITLGAFLVQRSAIARAQNYKRGREESAQASVQKQLKRMAGIDEGAWSPKSVLNPVWSVEKPVLSGSGSNDTEHLAALARSLEALYERPASGQRSSQVEKIPRVVLPEFPSKD
ncbi:MAG: hypothetical protein Q7T86_12820 [Hyphomicrobiaceae bacterium]|nr:hypothetical protein [Hyphomicrobiaceae bacterium]